MGISFVEGALLLSATFIAIAGLLFWQMMNYGCRLQELQTNQDNFLKSIREKLDQFQLEIKDVNRQCTDKFGSDNEEPYISKVKYVQDFIRKCEEDYLIYKQQFNTLQQSWPPPTTNSFRSYLTIRRQINLWKEYHQQTQEFYKTEIQSIEVKQLKLREHLQELYDLPIKVAECVQQLNQKIQSILTLMGYLNERGVRGAELNQIIIATQQVQNNVGQIPRYFRLLSAPEVRQQATKNDVIKAWPILERDKPVINAQLSQAEQLNDAYKELGDRLHTLEQKITDTKVEIKKISKAIKTDSYEETLMRLKRDISILKRNYRSLETESFIDLKEEIFDVEKRANLLRQEMDNAQQQFVKLQKVIENNGKLMADLERKMKQAEEDEPGIVWETGPQELIRLQQQADRLGSVNRQRDPEQLASDFAKAQTIKKPAVQLEQFIDKILKQYQAVALLLEDILLPEINWADQAETLAEKVRAYASHNWSRQLNITQIRNDAKKIATCQQSLLGSYRAGAPIPENWLLTDKMLQALQKFVGDRAQFINRLEAINDEYVVIHSKNETAKKAFEDMIEAIEQLGDLKPRFSNPNIILQIQELINLRSKYEKQLSQLFVPRNTDLVDNKARKVDQWYQACFKVIVKISQEVYKETAQERDKLRQKINDLVQIARFDKMAAMIKAKRLLANSPSTEKPSGNLQSLVNNYIIIQLKVQEEFWASYEALQKEIGNRIEESWEKLTSIQQEAGQAFNKYEPYRQMYSSSDFVLQNGVNSAAGSIDRARRLFVNIYECNDVETALKVINKSHGYFEAAINELHRSTNRE